MKTTLFFTIISIAMILATSVSGCAQINGISNPTVPNTEGGYTNSTSITKGETLKFYISTLKPFFDLDVYKLGINKTKVLTLHSLPGGLQPVPYQAYAVGCGWNSRAEIPISDDWKSGVYEADYPVGSGIEKLIFIVKEKILGSYSNTVVCLTENTWQAYNNWGGKSLYEYNSTDTIRSRSISFDRPYADRGAYPYFYWTHPLVEWLERENRNVEFCTNSDLDHDPSFLSHYTTFVTVGHDEYWSRQERNACQQLVNHGGKLIILSGNTCWWQVRYDDHLRNLTCFKKPEEDPLFGKQDSLVTTVWSRSPVNESEGSLLGTTFDLGGYVNTGKAYLQSDGFGGYTAFHTTNWIYNRTGIRDGDIIGQADPIAGYEVDGAKVLFTSDGVLQPILNRFTPKSFEILGMTPAAHDKTGTKLGAGLVTYYTNPQGGAVFNVATTDWVKGLQSDSIIIKMTENVFYQFCDKNILPPVVISFVPSTYTVENINGQSVDIIHRGMPLRFDKADTLVVHVWDPQAKPLRFRWSVNNTTIGTDSVLILSIRAKELLNKSLLAAVAVSNGADSVIVSWWFLDSAIRFISMPPLESISRHTLYSYSAKVISLTDEHPKFVILSGPKWLHTTQDGAVSGITDTIEGTYTVILQSYDNQKHTTIQKLQIVVKNPLSIVTKSPDAITDPTAIPNPFTSQTEIRFTLKDEAKVFASIYDIKGSQITSLANGALFHYGLNILIWNGSDEHGASIPAGIYLCRIVIQSSNGSRTVFIHKIVKFK